MSGASQFHRSPFKTRVQSALADTALGAALAKAGPGLIGKRATALDSVTNFDALRAHGAQIKQHTLSHLDAYAVAFEEKVHALGGQVHWAEDVRDAQEILLKICRDAKAERITKGKSMVSEEMGVNAALESAGYSVTETDLGEYIIQLRGETPSHIIAPAVHLRQDAVRETFLKAHDTLDPERNLDTAEDLLEEARDTLRSRYFDADIGITGANFLIAESGGSVIITNEGNGDLTQNAARVHVVLASLEKLVPTFNDAAHLTRLLTRSATGQEASVYMSVAHGPKRGDDMDGPEAYHVILLDHGRTDMLASERAQMLSCIRCGACMNHCPVYHAIGGHAYDAVYVGPMGAVLSPSLFDVGTHADLPHASSFCGRCAEVCPVKIDLPAMMRRLRERTFEDKLTPARGRIFLGVWSFLARRPRLYRALCAVFAPLVRVVLLRAPWLFAPLTRAWTCSRAVPVPQGRTFQSLFHEDNH